MHVLSGISMDKASNTHTLYKLEKSWRHIGCTGTSAESYFKKIFSRYIHKKIQGAYNW